MKIDSERYPTGFGDGDGKGYDYRSGGEYGDGSQYGDCCGGGFGYGTGYLDGAGYGYDTPVSLYFMTPYARLTPGADWWNSTPQDDTFENFMLHLQVEPLVHRRMG